MANLTQHFKTTKHLIDSGEIVEQPRPYLGLSGIGHPCPRYIWYTFHWAYESKLSKRMRRLFDRGHREEDFVIAILKRIGYTVHSQQKEIVQFNGHVKGHIDGIVEGVIEAPKTPHLAEFKTMKDNRFKELKKKGSIRAVHMVYYIQSQMYMNYLGLKRTLFVVTNKNDDDIYVERVRLDKDEVHKTESKILRILSSKGPPTRAFNKTYFECKWCPAYQICHERALPEVHCRTCDHAMLEEDGQWFCSKHGGIIPLDFQRKGCDQFKLNPIMRED